MHIFDADQRSEEWHEFRKGKITGTRLGTIWSARQYTKSDVENLLIERGVDKDQWKELTGKKSPLKGDLESLLTDEDKAVLSSDAEKKLEYYQILADQVAVPWNGENVMDRGLDLEPEALQIFAEKFNKELLPPVGCCVSDIDPRIINSPDGLIKGKGKKITEAVEVKCLASSKHLMSFFERKTPEEYWTQKVQYFVVNESLKTLYWVFYDPRIPMLPMFVLIIKREDLGHWPETMLKYQQRTLKELDELTVRLIEESDQIMLPAKAEK